MTEIDADRHIIGRHVRVSLEPPIALTQWGRSACSGRMDPCHAVVEVKNHA